MPNNDNEGTVTAAFLQNERQRRAEDRETLLQDRLAARVERYQSIEQIIADNPPYPDDNVNSIQLGEALIRRIVERDVHPNFQDIYFDQIVRHFQVPSNDDCHMWQGCICNECREQRITAVEVVLRNLNIDLHNIEVDRRVEMVQALNESALLTSEQIQQAFGDDNPLEAAQQNLQQYNYVTTVGNAPNYVPRRVELTEQVQAPVTGIYADDPATRQEVRFSEAAEQNLNRWNYTTTLIDASPTPVGSIRMTGPYPAGPIDDQVEVTTIPHDRDSLLRMYRNMHAIAQTAQVPRVDHFSTVRLQSLVISMEQLRTFIGTHLRGSGAYFEALSEEYIQIFRRLDPDTEDDEETTMPTLEDQRDRQALISSYYGMYNEICRQAPITDNITTVNLNRLVTAMQAERLSLRTSDRLRGMAETSAQYRDTFEASYLLIYSRYSPTETLSQSGPDIYTAQPQWMAERNLAALDEAISVMPRVDQNYDLGTSIPGNALQRTARTGTWDYINSSTLLNGTNTVNTTVVAITLTVDELRTIKDALVKLLGNTESIFNMLTAEQTRGNYEQNLYKGVRSEMKKAYDLVRKKLEART